MEHPANVDRRLQFNNITDIIAFIRDTPPTKESLVDIYHALVSYRYRHTSSALSWPYSREYLLAHDPLITLVGIGSAAAIESEHNEIQSAIFHLICTRFHDFITSRLAWPIMSKKIIGNLIYENNSIRITN